MSQITLRVTYNGRREDNPFLLKEWRLDGSLHREDGPAYVSFNNKDNMAFCYYYFGSPKTVDFYRPYEYDRAAVVQKIVQIASNEGYYERRTRKQTV